MSFPNAPSPVAVPEAETNKRHVFIWRDGDGVTEQDVLVLSPERTDLFPKGRVWRRLDLGGVILFIRRPLT